MFRIFLAIVLVAFSLDFALAQAAAGDAAVADTTVTGQPLINLIVEYAKALLNVMLPVVVGLAALWFKQKTGIDVDKGLRDGFQTSTLNAAGVLIQRLGAEASKMSKLDVRNPEVARAINMVMDGVPDAVKRFGITPEIVADRIEAKLGILTGATDAQGKPIAPSSPLLVEGIAGEASLGGTTRPGR